MEAEDKLHKLFSRGHVHDDVWEPAVAILKEAASQAREQALLEAENAIELLRVDGEMSVEHALNCARAAVSSMHTDGAQAQVQRRIVAGWLEERLAKFLDDWLQSEKSIDYENYEHLKPDPAPKETELRFNRIDAARVLLVALKEQE